MTQVVLVAATWWKVVDVPRAEELIEAEGMSWEREGTHHTGPDAAIADVPPELPRYVPAVGA